MNAVDGAAHLALKVAEMYIKLDTIDCTYGDVPPFVLPWMYKAGVRFVQTTDVKRLNVIESALRKLDTKWKAAGMCANLIRLV